jgi:hypothetical protein
MPTIVVHRSTGDRFVLVGTGFAATETALPGVFLGSLVPDIDTKICGMLALCDGEGNIHWRSSNDYIVGDVDGDSPSQILAALSHR